MVGFIATYVDVVATLEETGFKLQPPAKGSVPGIWEKRDLAIAWRCAHAATCGAICLTLFFGDPNIVFGPVAALFWTSLVAGSIALGQVLIESTLLKNRTSRAMKAVLVWYDLAFDTTIFEFHHFVTLIGAGTIVEFGYGGAATQIFVRLGLEDLLAALIGSPGWLIVAVALGLLMGTITLWSTKDTIDKIRSMYVGVIKESSPTKKDAEEASTGTSQAESSAEPSSEGTADRLLGGTLGTVGFLMKLINVTVGDTNNWIFLSLGILNRIVQVLLAIYSIYATSSLLEIDELITYYMLIAASYSIVVGSSIMAVLETARWVVQSQKIKGFFTPGSSMMKFYAILTLIYDTILAVFTDVTAAFTFALAITYCILGYTCEATTLIGGAFLWLIITFYFASLQSYNLLQLVKALVA